MKYKLGRWAIYISPVILIIVLAFMPGCKTSTVTQPLAPGYVNSNDQQFAQIIAGAESFYRTIQNDVNAHTYTPSPKELTSLNAFGVAINVAKGAAQQYKAVQSTANLQAAQSATSSLETQQKALAAQIPAGVQ